MILLHKNTNHWRGNKSAENKISKINVHILDAYIRPDPYIQ